MCLVKFNNLFGGKTYLKNKKCLDNPSMLNMQTSYSSSRERELQSQVINLQRRYVMEPDNFSWHYIYLCCAFISYPSLMSALGVLLRNCRDRKWKMPRFVHWPWLEMQYYLFHLVSIVCILMKCLWPFKLWFDYLFQWLLVRRQTSGFAWPVVYFASQWSFLLKYAFFP